MDFCSDLDSQHNSEVTSNKCLTDEELWLDEINDKKMYTSSTDLMSRNTESSSHRDPLN